MTEINPQVLETDRQYRGAGLRFGDLLGKGRRRTAQETKLMRLLGILIQDYDRRHAMPPDESTVVERLQFLIEHSGMTATDLLPIFGQRSHVNEALNGKRAISAAQAKKLGDLFHMNPGLFL